MNAKTTTTYKHRSPRVCNARVPRSRRLARRTKGAVLHGSNVANDADAESSTKQYALPTIDEETAKAINAINPDAPCKPNATDDATAA